MTLVGLWLIMQAAPPGTAGTSGLVILASLVGAGTGVSAAVVAWRNSRSTASQGYVDQNLAAMQAHITVLEEDNARHRTREVEHRKRIRELETELQGVRRECDECLARLTVLEERRD